jgi:hypothetical protein
MDEYNALSHTTWECKYHVVFIPKCRRKTLYLELRRHLGEVSADPGLRPTPAYRSTSSCGAGCAALAEGTSRVPPGTLGTARTGYP